MKKYVPFVLLVLFLGIVTFAAYPEKTLNAQYIPTAPQVKTLIASSGNQAASTCNATLPASTTGATNFLTGFTVTSLGATAATTVQVTITGTGSATTPTWVYPVAAGVTTANATLTVTFPHPIPASANNTAITVTMPTLGSGNTNAAIVAYGFQQ